MAFPVPLPEMVPEENTPAPKAIAGAVVKPLPALVMVMPVRVPVAPRLRTAVAVAPAPEPPLMVTVGAVV